MRRPIDPAVVITTEFGVPDSNAKFGRHAGVDYAKPSGSPVYAPVGGQVTDYTSGEYHGNVVQIKANDGKYHRLMHNSQLLVKPGQWVAEGQLVAKSGATGKGVTGPHVHWDIADRKVPVAFSNFYGPAKLLFAPTNIVQKIIAVVAPKKLYVHLPKHVTNWAVYRVGSGYRKGTSDQVGSLRPSNFNGLTYPVLENRGNVVVIQTQDFGRVAIWVQGTDAQLIRK